MNNLFKMVKELGEKKFLVRIYDFDELNYKENEMTYFELGTFLLTQGFVKIVIRSGD